MTNQVNQYERHMAIQEAYQIHDSDEYFKARPQLECGDRRKVFYAGHIRGYQAATQASEQRIQELESEIANLHTVMMAAAVEITERWEAHCDEDGCGPANLVRRLENGYPEQYGYDAKTMVRMDKQIDELTESNNKLREALEICKYDCHTGEVIGIAEKALKATPTQSLAEHDNDVIERIATALENAEGEFKTLPEYVSLVRALKND